MLEQVISTSANFLIAILMIRQLDINYLGKAQVFLIPYATLNAFLTTKYYLPIASLKKKLDKSIGFYIAAKIIIPILVLSLIFHVAYGYGLDGFVLGLAMGANLIATDFCRYYFIVFDNVDTAISVSTFKLLVFISSIPLITIKAYYSMLNVWLVLNLFSTILSFIGLLKITKNINLRWLLLHLSSFSFKKGAASTTYAISNSISGFVRSTSLALCGPGAYAAYNAYTKISNVCNPALQLIELRPRSRNVEFLQSTSIQLAGLIILFIGIFLTKDYINLSLLNYTTYKYRSLLFFVFFQVILAAFSRILSAKCRIVLSNAHFLFKVLGYLNAVFSIITFFVALVYRDIFMTACIVLVFYAVQYVILSCSLKFRLFNS